jgi:hypothetical protein
MRLKHVQQLNAQNAKKFHNAVVQSIQNRCATQRTPQNPACALIHSTLPFVSFAGVHRSGRRHPRTLRALCPAGPVRQRGLAIAKRVPTGLPLAAPARARAVPLRPNPQQPRASAPPPTVTVTAMRTNSRRSKPKRNTGQRACSDQSTFNATNDFHVFSESFIILSVRLRGCMSESRVYMYAERNHFSNRVRARRTAARSVLKTYAEQTSHYGPTRRSWPQPLTGTFGAVVRRRARRTLIANTTCMRSRVRVMTTPENDGPRR